MQPPMISIAVEAKNAYVLCRILTICMSPIRLSRASIRRIQKRRYSCIRLISDRLAPIGPSASAA